MLTPGADTGINNPFAWYAIVEELPDSKNPGKQWTIWMNGGGASREDVAKHVAEHYPHVKAITINRALTPPTRPVQPVPLHFYEWGYRAKALGLEEETEPQRIIVRKPITLKPLV